MRPVRPGAWPGRPAPHPFCLAQPAAPTAGLGPDGHPARGGFLPPVPLPRRMWAGGALTFHGDLKVGDVMKRVSRIADVTLKEGRTGPLCFVTVEHRVEANGVLVIEERQDIVYRGADASGGASKAPPPAEKGAHSKTLTASINRTLKRECERPTIPSAPNAALKFEDMLREP